MEFAVIQQVQVQPLDPQRGINRIGIADYRRVEQEVCCYVPGQVSHIENVLAREYKERHTRNLSSTETRIEVTRELEAESLTDTTSTERNELSTEVSIVLSEESSLGAGFSTGASGSVWGVELRADAYIDFASSTASSDSNTLAKTYAQEVTRRALERLTQKVSDKRTSTILREYEENNRHGFDNRTGDQNVTGIYRWVDLIYTNRLVNYGKRLMFEFMIPEPALFYKQAIQIQVEEGEQEDPTVTVIQEPTHPSQLEPAITSAEDINRDNYLKLAAQYHANVNAPSDETITVAESYNGTPQLEDFSVGLNPPIQIPIDYECDKASGSLTFFWDSNVWWWHETARIISTVGGQSWTETRTEGNSSDTETNEFEFSSPLTGTVAGSISGERIKSYTLSVEAECTLKPSKFEQWRTETYEAIIAGYDILQSEYEAASATVADEEGEESSDEIGTNPKFNQKVVQDELKRIAIEMLTQPFGLDQGLDFYGLGPCDVPQVTQNENFERYASIVKFFEQAFDWELMSFIFYPYYWADKCRCGSNCSKQKEPMITCFAPSCRVAWQGWWRRYVLGLKMPWNTLLKQVTFGAATI